MSLSKKSKTAMSAAKQPNTISTVPRKLPRPGVKLQADSKSDSLSSEIEEPKPIPWGSSTYESSISSSFADLSSKMTTSVTLEAADDDVSVDDKELTTKADRNDITKSLSVQEIPMKPGEQKRIERLEKENKQLRMEISEMKEKLATYNLASKWNGPKTHATPGTTIATPPGPTCTSPSSPEAQWQSSLIDEDFPEGLREETDPPSVSTITDSLKCNFVSINKSHCPKERDPNEWRTDFEFFLQQLERRNTIRTQGQLKQDCDGKSTADNGNTRVINPPVVFPKSQTRPPFRAGPTRPSPGAKAPKISPFHGKETSKKRTKEEAIAEKCGVDQTVLHKGK